MKKSFAAIMLAGAILFSNSAQAQGVFDLGALTSTISKNVPAQGAAASQPVPAANLAAMRYTPSMDVRKSNYAEMVKNFQKISPEMGNQFEAMFAQIDVIAEIDKAITPYGMSSSNIADAYAIYFLTAWMAANGRTDDATPEQFKGVQKTAQEALGASLDMLKQPDNKKQIFSESLLIQAMLNGEMVKAVANDPAALAKVKNDTKTAAKEMGIDLDSFIMTPTGLERKKTK